VLIGKVLAKSVNRLPVPERWQGIKYGTKPTTPSEAVSPQIDIIQAILIASYEPFELI
jgi:hypothetical protein